MSALHFEVRGRGRDLVLLHGWGLNLRVWDELAGALARRFRVIAIDLPGHGKSDWDARASTPAAALRDTAPATTNSVDVGIPAEISVPPTTGPTIPPMRPMPKDQPTPVARREVS